MWRGKEAPSISVAIDEKSSVAAATAVASVVYCDGGGAARIPSTYTVFWKQQDYTIDSRNNKPTQLILETTRTAGVDELA
ncbi:hypothetical protein L1887_36047 [Cichorium endivia]|nr:hypothetical protein L1887_36047 [Cichorium endivia]